MKQYKKQMMTKPGKELAIVPNGVKIAWIPAAISQPRMSTKTLPPITSKAIGSRASNH